MLELSLTRTIKVSSFDLPLHLGNSHLHSSEFHVQRLINFNLPQKKTALHIFSEENIFMIYKQHVKSTNFHVFRINMNAYLTFQKITANTTSLKRNHESFMQTLTMIQINQNITNFTTTLIIVITRPNRINPTCFYYSFPFNSCGCLEK